MKFLLTKVSLPDVSLFFTSIVNPVPEILDKAKKSPAWAFSKVIPILGKKAEVDPPSSEVPVKKACWNVTALLDVPDAIAVFTVSVLLSSSAV